MKNKIDLSKIKGQMKSKKELEKSIPYWREKTENLEYTLSQAQAKIKELEKEVEELTEANENIQSANITFSKQETENKELRELIDLIYVNTNAYDNKRDAVRRIQYDIGQCKLLSKTK